MNIYADNAATTKMSRIVIQAMTNCMENCYGNPSSLYGVGQDAKEALEDARGRVAQVPPVHPVHWILVMCFWLLEDPTK